MRNDKFFKHDASASDDERMMVLIEKEGMKGYGVYWILLEALRKQENLCLSYNILRPLAYRCRVRQDYLLRIVKDYGLFVVMENGFYSAGMTRRMSRYQQLTGCTSVKQSVKEVDNSLTDSTDDVPNVSYKDKIRKDSNLTVVDAATVEGQQPVRPYQSWEELVDQMAASEDFMNQAGMHSGLGRLFLLHQAQVVHIFKTHICLQGKQGCLSNVGQMKSYFSNFVCQGSFTNKKLRTALEREEQQHAAKSPYRFEEIVEGRRLYLGHPIPDEAPPRPDASSVWDDVGRRWLH